jgi:hypothetical protein
MSDALLPRPSGFEGLLRQALTGTRKESNLGAPGM